MIILIALVVALLLGIAIGVYAAFYWVGKKIGL